MTKSSCAKHSFLVVNIICASCFLLCSVTARAQFRAGIQGVVADPSGGAVPDAAVTLTSQETNISHRAKTSEAGAYTISGLAPGIYRLTVEKAGFSTKVLDTVVIRAEQIESLNVELAVGNVSQSVTVKATPPLVDAETATVGGTLTSREVENLPSFGRDPYQLLRLTPGVFGDGAQSSGGGTTQMPGVNKPSSGAVNSIFYIENAPQIIANGTRQNSNNIQVDGVGINSVSWGGSSVLTPGEESIKEVKVVANSYSAENGRNSGAQIMIISKNGTNEFHGSGFFKWHRPGLNAFQRWNGPGVPSPVKRDANRFNQFGGSLGGPIIRNKLFAFFSYEGLRDASKSFPLAWFETAEFRQNAGPTGSLARKMLSFPGQAPLSGTVSSLTCAQVGLPSTQCRDVPGGLDLGSPLALPLGQPDPTWQKPGTPYGIGSGFDGIPDVMRLQVQTPSSTVNAQYNGRLDFQPTDKDLLAVSIYWVPTIAHSMKGAARSLNQWNSDRLSRSWTGIWNRTFSPTLINEARFGLSGWKYDETESNPQEPWGLPIIQIDKAGTIGFEGFGAQGPGVFDQSTWNARDILSKVHSSHLLKFGADISGARFLDDSSQSARPTYSLLLPEPVELRQRCALPRGWQFRSTHGSAIE